MGNSRWKIIWRVLGAISFGFAFFIYSYISKLNCPIGECYLSSDAWYLLPLLFLTPAFIVQFASYLVLKSLKRLESQKHFYLSVFAHAILSVIFFDTWLLLTGQGLQFMPAFDKDFSVFLSGAIMGGLIYFGSNPSIKRDA